MITGLKKYQFHIIATLTFILFSYWLNVWIQALIAFSLIFSVGIIHGANDLQLIQKKTQKKSNSFFLTSLVLYIGVVLLGIGLFYGLPAFGLLFFVAFSAFHFGEQHLEAKVEPSLSPWIKMLLYTSYGAALFGLLFTLQWTEVHQVIFLISEQFVPKQWTEYLCYIGLGGFLVTGLFSPNLRGWLFFELLLLVFLGFLFSRASLVLGFGVYFVIWHSFPSVKDQMMFLYPKSEQARWQKYLRSSAPYWIFSLLGLAGVYFFFDVSSTAFLPLFFSFLAAITFPHTVVMGWLKLSEEKDTSSPQNPSDIPLK
ncbi:MAG: Brp/Blh family beta-carotene 15,15'-dioxygenase [Flavobacteriaceae bacterium]